MQATPQRRTPISVDTPASDRELVLTRLIDAPREKLFRAWTEPEVLKQWFTPAPYTTPVAELDVRPGGANLIVMRDPEGNSSSSNRFAIDSPLEGTDLPPMIKQKKRGGNPA